MRRPHRLLRTLTCATVAGALLCATPCWPDQKKDDEKEISALRWQEGAPGCTFIRGTDGKLRFGVWSGDIGITLAVDAQELEKVHRRHEHFFAALLEFRYRGQKSAEVKPDKISLEFVNHFQVMQYALDPDQLSKKLQDDDDALNDQIAREVKKSPEKKEVKEALLRTYLKESAELQEFIGKSSLRDTQLDPSNAQTSGWVFFSTNNKWIGGWKKQEQLIVRVPISGQRFEFPFTLPPPAGEVLLRRR